MGHRILVVFIQLALAGLANARPLVHTPATGNEASGDTGFTVVDLTAYLDCYRAMESFYRVWTVHNLATQAAPEIVVPANGVQGFYLFSGTGARFVRLPVEPAKDGVTTYTLNVRHPDGSSQLIGYTFVPDAQKAQYKGPVVRVFPSDAVFNHETFLEVAASETTSSAALRALAANLGEKLREKRDNPESGDHSFLAAADQRQIEAGRSRRLEQMRNAWQSCRRVSDRYLRSQAIEALASFPLP